MAGATGLEPATSCVTGRRSNQTELHPRIWWAVRGSNPRHPRCKHGALPAELTALNANPRLNLLA